MLQCLTQDVQCATSPKTRFGTLHLRDAGTGGDRGATGDPQFLADQLTIFQPGKGRLCPPITTVAQRFSPSGIPAPADRFQMKIENKFFCCLQ